MSIDNEQELSDLDRMFAGDVSNGENMLQTGVAVQGSDRPAYKLMAFVPSIPDGKRGGVPEGAAHFVIPDITKARVVRMVNAFQTTFIPKVPASFNRLFVNVDRNNWPNPTPLQDAIWSSVIPMQYGTDQESRARAAQVYLVPCITLYGDEPEPVIAEMSIGVYNTILERNEDSDSDTEGKINLANNAIFVWRIKGEKGKSKAKFDRTTDAKKLMKQFADQMPDVAEYVKERSKATEEFFKRMYTINSLGHKDMELDTSTRETEFADLVPNLEPDQLKAVFKRYDIDFPATGSKMALIDIAIRNTEVLFDAVKEIADNNPPF